MKLFILFYILIFLNPFKVLAGITDHNLILSSGQSLSIGHTDITINQIIYDGEVNTNKVFLFNGVRTIAPAYNRKLESSDVSYLVPLKDITRQTHAFSMFKKLETLYGEMDKPFPSFIYAPHARGGAKISELFYGTDPFYNGNKMLLAAQSLLSQQGQPFNVPFITWIHGESNAGTNLEKYKRDLQKLHNSYKNSVRSTSSETKNPILFMDQTGASYAHDIAIASWEYSNENPETILVMPKYHLNRNFYSSESDRTHLNSKGYLLQGEYFAKAIFSTYVLGKKWKPLQPEKIRVDKNIIFVELNVPEGKIVIDTSTLPEAPGYGFKYVSPAGINYIPTVMVTGNTLKLEFDTNIQVGGKLDAGYTLNDSDLTGGVQIPLSNIRDTSNQKSMVDGGYLHNWLVQFKVDITPQTLGMAELIPVIGSNIWSYGNILSDNAEEFSILGGDYNKANLDYALYRIRFDIEVIAGSAVLQIGDLGYPVLNSGSKVFVAKICKPYRSRLNVMVGESIYTGKLSAITVKPILLNTGYDDLDNDFLGEDIWPGNASIASNDIERFSLIAGEYQSNDLDSPIYLIEFESIVESGTAIFNLGDFQNRVNSNEYFRVKAPVCISKNKRLRFIAGKEGFSGEIRTVIIEAI